MKKYFIMTALALFLGLTWYITPPAFQEHSANFGMSQHIQLSKNGSLMTVKDTLLNISFSYPATWGAIQVNENAANDYFERRLNLVTKKGQIIEFLVAHDMDRMNEASPKKLGAPDILAFVCPPQLCDTKKRTNSAGEDYTFGTMLFEQDDTSKIPGNFYQFINEDAEYESIIFMDFYIKKLEETTVLEGFEKNIINSATLIKS